MSSVGSYEPLGTLAQGGMAQVQLARARGRHGFEKLVVLKRIHAHLAEDPGFVEMFLDEARLAAQLDHPNVVQVFDIGEDQGGVFFAMEYLRGADLRQLLRAQDGSLPLERALTIAIGAAAGLHHAHRKVGLGGEPLAVIHRDVSPTNVIVTYEGAVKLVDFGIAKAAPNRHKSRQSSLKGKVAYMSPEQCEGGRLGPRSDVFSLGAVLYELTTGVKPYGGETEFALMNEIVNRPVRSPRDRASEYPPALCEIVLRAMHRDEDARFASAGEMRDALEGFAVEQGFTLSAAELGAYVGRLVPPSPLDPHAESEQDAEPASGSRTAATIRRPPANPSSNPSRPDPRRRRWFLLAAGVGAVAIAPLLLLADDDPRGATTPRSAVPAEAASGASAPETGRAGAASTQDVGDVAASSAGAQKDAPPIEAAAQSDADTARANPATPGAAVAEPEPVRPGGSAPPAADASPPTPRPPKGRARRGKKGRQAERGAPSNDRPAQPPSTVDGNSWVPVRREAP